MAENRYRLSNPFSRIIGFSFGGSFWDFYGSEIALSELPPGFVINAILFSTTGSNINTDGTGLLTAVSTFGKSRGLSKNSGAWKIIDPDSSLSDLHSGEYDSEALSAARVITANDDDFCILVNVNSGAERHMISGELFLSVPFTGAEEFLLGTNHDPDPQPGQEYTPAASNFYWILSGVPIVIHGLNEQGEVLALDNENAFNTDPVSTLHDVFIAVPSYDFLSMLIYSVRKGLVTEESRLSSFADINGAIISVSTKDKFILFDVEAVETDMDDPDLDLDFYIGITKVVESYGVTGLEYSTSKETVSFRSSTGSECEFIGVAATRSQGYAFCISPEEGGSPPVGEQILRIIDGDGNVELLDANFVVHDSDDSTRIEMVFGQTIDHPWMATFDRRIGTRRLRIYNDTGMVYESDEVMAGADGVTLKLFLNGNTRDHIFFGVKGSAGEQFIVRGDGQTFDLQDYRPSATLPFPSGQNNVLPSITSRDVIFNLFTNPGSSPLEHVTNLQGETPAPVFKEYVSGLASANVPVRSNLLRLQEFEAWA